jgi:hypothetical protein
MKKDLVHIVAILSVLVIGACAGNHGGEVTKEITADTMTVEVVATPDTGPTPEIDLVERLDEGILATQDFGHQEITPECEAGEGCFLDKCTENSQCQSGWCVEHMGEGVCSQSCQDECPAGWSCQHVAGSDPDVVYICVPNYVNLCRPCSTAMIARVWLGQKMFAWTTDRRGASAVASAVTRRNAPGAFHV